VRAVAHAFGETAPNGEFGAWWFFPPNPALAGNANRWAAPKQERTTMYCSACGKQIPENSIFCLYCGSRIKGNSNQSVPEWEYRDFVYSYLAFPRDSRPARYKISLVQRRHDIWAEQQRILLPKLQQWFDEGWQPITEIGAASFEWASEGDIERAVAFRVKMRAPKGTKIPSSPEDPMSVLMSKVKTLVLDKSDEYYYKQGYSYIRHEQFNEARLEFAKVLHISTPQSKWYAAAQGRLDEIGLAIR
jgi:hypothetical protein